MILLAAVSALVGLLAGGIIEHHRIVRKMQSEFTLIQKEMCDHLDSVKNKSEIMIRHDAGAFRANVSARAIKWLS
jgi:hypothetical protein